MKNMISVRGICNRSFGGDKGIIIQEAEKRMSVVFKYDDDDDAQDDDDDDDRDYNCFVEDDGCEPMKGPRSEPQMMSMHEEHKKIEVGNPLN